ncbi:MAG: alpha/beta fold hydrolase [Planctomycetaceae bacterium]|nr:alpha/beta fold hydrolase [Planctomycetaceae bacterium]
MSVPANAQTSRLELGRRLKRFELVWEAAAPAERTKSVAPLKVAVTSFFSLNLPEAGRQLDQAWLAVRGQKASALEDSVISLQCLPTPVCADVNATAISLQAKPFYGAQASLPEDVRVQVKLHDATGALLTESEFALKEMSEPVAWETGILPEGDHALSVTFVLESETYEPPAITISRIANLEARIAALEKAAAARKASAANDLQRTVAATLRDEARLIRNLSQGRLQEADFPILSRLQFCESLAGDIFDPANVTKSVAGKSDVWMTLAKGTKTASTRLRFPASLEKPLPVLFVFHGAGGSENMFFETYGAGRVIREAEKRGWLVVSPGQGLLGLSLGLSDMLDALEPFAKLDRSRIMVLGHSMGAAQVMTQVQKHPTLPIAAIALGGGSRMAVKDASQAPKARWFVAAGEQDFGRSGARQLHRSLTDAGVQSQYKDYPEVEHLVIVQAAIDDSFKFLDDVLANTKP